MQNFGRRGKYLNLETLTCDCIMHADAGYWVVELDWPHIFQFESNFDMQYGRSVPIAVTVSHKCMMNRANGSVPESEMWKIKDHGSGGTLACCRLQHSDLVALFLHRMIEHGWQSAARAPLDVAVVGSVPRPREYHRNRDFKPSRTYDVWLWA